MEVTQSTQPKLEDNGHGEAVAGFSRGFTTLVESKRERSPRVRILAFQIALVVHAVVFGTILVRHWLQVPPIHEPPLRVTFAQVAAPPPPPPPPAPPKAVAPKPVEEAPMPQEMVEPVETPDIVSTEPIPVEPDFGGVEDGVPGGVPGGVAGGVVSEPTTYRVGQGATPPEPVSQPKPQYPALAAASHLTGVVILEAVIATDGSVRDVKVLRGLGMGLTEAAVDAVKQWRYKPAVLDGVPVQFALTVTVSFKL